MEINGGFCARWTLFWINLFACVFNRPGRLMATVDASYCVAIASSKKSAVNHVLSAGSFTKTWARGR